MCHVWTAPDWQGLSSHRRLGRCSHVFGLFAQFLAETQPQLTAHHLAQAGLTEPAIDYLRKAGHRAIECSGSAEAIGHLKRALQLLQSLPDGPKHKRTALELQVMLGQAMIACRGYAASETPEILT
jgi:predicted ATPase